jgi:lipopolysaccharide export system protein LptC
MSLRKIVWDRFLLYLPILVMGLLASGTYWLVRSAPPGVGPSEKQPVTHDPDYFMRQFSVKTFDKAGVIRSEVGGDYARHYPDTQWTEIDGIRIRSFDTKGRLTTATALKGLTNEDQSEVQLMGDAVVVREADSPEQADAGPKMEFRGEFLHIFVKSEQIRSHKPVTLQRGADRFTADSMSFDKLEQVLELRGRVRGTLVPVKK